MKPLHRMFLKKDWLLLEACLSILIGVLLWLYPDIFVKATVMLIGILLAFYSVIAFVTILKNDNKNGARQAIIISAVISFIVGVFLLASPALFVNLLVIFLGIIVIGLGLVQATEINLLKHQHHSVSALHYVSPIIIMIIGLLVIIQPAQIATIIVKLCAIGIFYAGVSGLLYTFRLRKPENDNSILSENNE